MKAFVTNERSLLLISFCEEDYAVTKYIAEFINTLTNLTYGK